MKQFKYLIIGGGIAGTNAASAIREIDRTGSILLLTAEKERLYSRVLLPNYLKGTLPLERVFLKKETFYEENQIEFLNQTTVTAVLPHENKVETAKGDEYGYEKLLLTTGGEANRLGVAGENLDGIFTLKTYEDAQKISAALKEATCGVVIGGRFIALEFMGSFRQHNLKTTTLVMEERLFAPFLDEEGGGLLERILKTGGVEIKFNEKTMAFTGEKKVESVQTQGGLEQKADIVGLGIGITPQTNYIPVGSGLVVGGRIETNQYLQTKNPNIYAAGDVARFWDLTSQRYHSLGNWANAADQGRVAGLNLAGANIEFRAASTYSINFFGTSLALIGDTNAHYADTIIKRGSSQAGYYGNLYLKDDTLIGAVLIGLPQDRGPVGNLIKNRTPIAQIEKLKDHKIDLSELAND